MRDRRERKGWGGDDHVSQACWLHASPPRGCVCVCVFEREGRDRDREREKERRKERERERER